MTTNASRAPIDLDAFERDMQQLHLQGRPETTGKGDPLAELARIVGQDDPFRALLAARDERRPARTEPGFPAPHAEPAQASARPGDLDSRPGQADHATQGVPADAFDQYLASIDRDFGAPGLHEGESQEPLAEDDARSLRRARPRRSLYAVGAGIAVVAVSVAGSLAWRSTHHDRTGGVPLIQADTAPLKIAPKTADGVEIPDQNKQIYEPRAKDGQIRIVNREEQPIDVGQSARANQGADGASGGATPQGGLADAFGEPRRVRTVSVKPDTPVPPPQAREPETATPAPIPTLVMPTEAEAAPVAPTPAKVRPVRPASATMAAVVPAAATTPPPEAVPVAAPAPVRTKAPQRVASVAPESISPVEAPATTAATTSATSVAGGYAVQLGVSGSERDAQAALRGFQAKYSQLSGKPELIRQAEVNGKSIYRVRVGPFAKAEANSLCEGLKGEGGTCFVAKN